MNINKYMLVFLRVGSSIRNFYMIINISLYLEILELELLEIEHQELTVCTPAPTKAKLEMSLSSMA